MGFLGVGLPELVVIVLVAVIVLGPERLPEAAVQLAKLVKMLRGYATDTTSQLRSELVELTREYEGVRKELQEFRDTVRLDMSSVTRELDKVLSESRPDAPTGQEGLSATATAPALTDVPPSTNGHSPETGPIIEPAGDLPGEVIAREPAAEPAPTPVNAASIEDILSDTEPIIEPGGELPPANGAKGPDV